MQSNPQKARTPAIGLFILSTNLVQGVKFGKVMQCMSTVKSYTNLDGLYLQLSTV